MSLLTQFRKYPIREQLMFPEAAFLLTVATLVVRFMPFKRLQQRLSRPLQVQTPSEQSEQIAAQVGRVVRSAARHLPWECACLVQALAARNMLRRRRVSTALSIGVAPGEKEGVDSHAWLVAGARIVTGREGHERFKEMLRFTA